MKRAVIYAGGWFVAPTGAIGRFLFRYVFVYVYRGALTARRVTRRFFGQSRHRTIAVLANRYSVHTVIVILALIVSTTSVKAREVQTTDSGDKTLLFSILASNSTDYNATVEDQTPAIYQPAGINYPGNGTLRLSTNYDYDYEPFTPTTFATVAGGAVIAPTGQGTGRSVAARDQVVEYRVEQGDTIGSISADYQVSISTILWANNMGPRDYLQIGQVLKIPPMDGVLHTVKIGDTVAKIATRYGAVVDEILTANRLSSAGELRIGDVIMVPNGEPPTPSVPKTVVVPRPVASIKSIFIPPSASANRTTKLLWPTPGHSITQYYGGWECVSGCRVHTGLDVDGDYTSPLYAAEDGIVIFSGWRSGYGYSIDIDHGGGMVTRYGHSSKLFVKTGDYVKRGQTIAMMGSTGYSTGTHIHFEVRVNGVPKNPLGYLR